MSQSDENDNEYRLMKCIIETDCAFCKGCCDCPWEVKFLGQDKWKPLCQDCYDDLHDLENTEKWYLGRLQSLHHTQ